MRRCCLLPVVATLALLSGCLAPGMGGLSMAPTIAGGQRVRVDFDSHGIVFVEDDHVRIRRALLVPHLKEKYFAYEFSFQAKPGHAQPPRSVKIDDVTDDDILSYVDDEHPVLNQEGIWTTIKSPIDPASLPWLIEIENSMRIFRFTIVMADGGTLVLYQGASYPAVIKKYFREELGIDKKEVH
jgi:hypothetical protein